MLPHVNGVLVLRKNRKGKDGEKECKECDSHEGYFYLDKVKL